MSGDGTAQRESEAASPAWQEGWRFEQAFAAELVQVRAARAWLREVFSPACLLRDDCVTVLSELLANCAEHGGGGQVSVVVTHVWGRVTGMLVHHAAPTARVRLPAPGVLEVPVIEQLEETGRGLAVVVGLCDGEVEIEQYADRTVMRWRLHDSCACEEADGD
ncbi:ATP-binding protein [Actinocorallia populi]|uniref:ATP-binding protein n=1 Tax=Actinocorallia populi TaxID=2079200 RepID=UPI000D0869EC|nr:ATP-binding protein [Actinocorallia populi]